MTAAPSLCHPDRITQFLQGEMQPQERMAFESHLDHCEVCREALDQAVASPESWSELRMSLDENRQYAPRLHSSSRLQAAEFPDLEACRRLLGPTDDPRMMGRIGSYEIVGVLGRGGMGIVFKGLDPALNRYVAIKLLAPVFSASGSSRQRFLREAQSAAAVVHEHVVAIHGISQWQDTPYLVMDYVRGESLQKRLADRGALPIRELLRIGHQVAAGLAAAHAQGLIHRDIKPANILMETDVDRVRITDFGLARAVDDIRLTRTDMVLGTPQYMSPEQARDQVLDFCTDLYSLGVVLYEAATGRPPFQAATSYGTLRKIVDQQPASFGRLEPEIPRWFERIVMRLLEKNPRERFQSASEVAALLQQCLAHVEQPQLVRLPASLQENKRLDFVPTRRIAMCAVAVTAVVVGSLLILNAPFAPDGDKRSSSSAVAKNGKSTIGAEGKASVSVRSVADLTDIKMEMRFDLGQIPVQPQGKGFRNSGGEGFAGGAAGGGGGSFLKPNLGVALTVESPVANEETIVEVSRSATAYDDQGRMLMAIDPAPGRVSFPAFEATIPGSQTLYFAATKDAKYLARLEGTVLVTPGRVLVATFEGPKFIGRKTQLVSGETFTLEAVTKTPQGIELAVICPETKALAGAATPHERMQSLIAGRSAYSAEIEDDAGEVHNYERGQSGGFGGGAIGFGPAPGRQKGSGMNHVFQFASLPAGRQIKSIRIRMMERAGETRSLPFTLENVGIR